MDSYGILSADAGPNYVPTLQTVKYDPHRSFGASVQKKGEEQFLITEIKGQDTFFGVLRGLDCIYFDDVGGRKQQEITVELSLKYFTVRDLRLVALTGL